MEKIKSPTTTILYHGTGSQYLKGIYKSKALLPNSKTGLMVSGLEGDGEFGFIKSLNPNGIYLASEEKAESYANSAVYTDETMPAFPVVIKVEVDTKNLLPDLDDLGKFYQFSIEKEKWEQSMDKIQQCVHDGMIPINQILGVRFSNSLNDIVPDKDYKFDEYLTNEVQKHLYKWYPINEIIDIIESMEQYIKENK